MAVASVQLLRRYCGNFTTPHLLLLSRTSSSSTNNLFATRGHAQRIQSTDAD